MNMINKVKSSWILCKVITLLQSIEAFWNIKKWQTIFGVEFLYVTLGLSFFKKNKTFWSFAQAINLVGCSVQFY